MKALVKYDADTGNVLSLSDFNLFDPQQYVYTLGGQHYHLDKAIIPTPGAILLGSIGVGLVGWLRRRRTL